MAEAFFFDGGTTMGKDNVSHLGPMVRQHEIRWTSDQFPHVESVDVLALDDEEIFNYARDLQLECAALRALLHESLSAVQRLTVQLQRSTRIVQELRRAA